LNESDTCDNRPVPAPLYHELPAPLWLSDTVACLWIRCVPADAARDEHRVLPDGCMDLIAFDDGRLVVAGPDTGPSPAGRPPGSTSVGVRFRPGAGPALLRVPASAVRDLRVDLESVWGAEGRRLGEQVAAAGTPPAKLAALVAALREEEGPDPVVGAAVDRLLDDPSARVGWLAGHLGLSERHLHRRFEAAVGYGPKTLARVLRFRRLLALPASQGLAVRAARAGYADQAHMTRECVRLAGVPPSALLR
jgi:AraC-like DNA-binding protein